MVLRWHRHRGKHRGGWSRAIRCAGGTRVVLAASPRQPDPRVADGVALHLVDSHLGSVSLHKLHKSTAFAGGNLDVGDLAKALEEGAQFVFGDIAREAADKDGGVIGIGELVHGLGSAVVAHGRGAHRVQTHGAGGAAGATHGGGGAGSALGSGG